MIRRVCFPFACVYTTPAGSHTHTHREAAGGPRVDTPKGNSYICTFGHLDVWTSGQLDIWTFGLSPESYPVITAKAAAVISFAVTSMLFEISSQRGTELATPGIRTVIFNQGRRRGQQHTKPKEKEMAKARGSPHIPHVGVALIKLRHSQGNPQASWGILYSRQCIITTLYFEPFGLEHSGISGWRAS